MPPRIPWNPLTCILHKCTFPLNPLTSQCSSIHESVILQTGRRPCDDHRGRSRTSALTIADISLIVNRERCAWVFPLIFFPSFVVNSRRRCARPLHCATISKNHCLVLSPFARPKTRGPVFALCTAGSEICRCNFLGEHRLTAFVPQNFPEQRCFYSRGWIASWSVIAMILIR